MKATKNAATDLSCVAGRGKTLIDGLLSSTLHNSGDPRSQKVTKTCAQNPERQVKATDNRGGSEIRPQHTRSRGNLHETLDPLLTPRICQKAGRPKGTPNYHWSPAADAILLEWAGKGDVSKAKRAVFRELEAFHGGAARTRPDAYRKAVRRRLNKLGSSKTESGRSDRKGYVRPWTEAQVKALIGSVGEDVSWDTMAKRTGHSAKAVRAKMARLARNSHKGSRQEWPFMA